jgi:hypothetical protein
MDTKTVLHLNSYDRTSGDPSSFSTNVGDLGFNPSAISILSVEAVNQYYNVNQMSNTLTVTVVSPSNVTYNISPTIAPGNWTSTSIVAPITNALNAALSTASGNSSPSSLFQVSQSGLTNIVTISTNTAGWKFSVSANGSLDYILGFRSSGIAGTLNTVQSGTSSLDLRQYPVLYIRSNLGDANSLSANHTISNTLLKLQNNVPFGQTCFWRSVDPSIDRFDYSGNLSQVVITVTDEYGHKLNADLNLDWTLSLVLYP